MILFPSFTRILLVYKLEFVRKEVERKEVYSSSRDKAALGWRIHRLPFTMDSIE